MLFVFVQGNHFNLATIQLQFFVQVFVPITYLGEILGMIECKNVGYKQ